MKSNYKEIQKMPESSRRVLWVSCQLVEIPKDPKDPKAGTIVVKQRLQGTYLRNQSRIKGKAAIKAAKKASHIRNYYGKQRALQSN